MYTLSADFGTSSVKAAVIDENRNIVKISRRGYQYQILGQEQIELDMDAVEAAFYGTIMELKEFLPYIGLISFDTFAPSLVMMGKDGEALYPIVTHLDRRSRRYTKEIMEKFGKNTYRNITGTLPYAGGVTLTTLLWFRDNRPDVFGQIDKIGHLSTYLYRKLTGEWAIDEVNASITGMYDTVGNTGWSEEICGRFGISKDILPPVKDVDTTFAPILPDMAARLGVGRGTSINLGTQDVASALAGAGVNQSGQILCISGSSEMIAILTDQPVTNDRYYLRNSGIKGLWQVFSITTGGFALDWLREQFYREMTEEEFYQVHLPKVLETSFDTGGVTFHPYLTGDRQSLKRKRGSFTGLTLNTERDHLLCALVVGIQSQTRKTLDICHDMIPKGQQVKATGNLAENPAYIQIKSSLFGGAGIQVIDNCPLLGNVRGGVAGKREKAI